MHEGPRRLHEGKPLLGGHRDRGLGLLTDRRPMPAQLVQDGVIVKRTRQGIGVRQMLRQGQGLVAAGASLLWIPPQPQGPPTIAKDCYA